MGRITARTRQYFGIDNVCPAAVAVAASTTVAACRSVPDSDSDASRAQRASKGPSLSAALAAGVVMAVPRNRAHTKRVHIYQSSASTRQGEGIGTSQKNR